MFSPENKFVFCRTKALRKKKQLNESSPKCGEENGQTQRLSSPQSSLPHRVPASAGCLSVAAAKRRRSGLGVLAAVGGWRRGRGADNRGEGPGDVKAHERVRLERTSASGWELNLVFVQMGSRLIGDRLMGAHPPREHCELLLTPSDVT